MINWSKSIFPLLFCFLSISLFLLFSFALYIISLSFWARAVTHFREQISQRCKKGLFPQCRHKSKPRESEWLANVEAVNHQRDLQLLVPLRQTKPFPKRERMRMLFTNATKTCESPLKNPPPPLLNLIKVIELVVNSKEKKGMTE